MYSIHMAIDKHKTPRTTISLHDTTKIRLNKGRAHGQSYDGFICQLIDLWDKSHLQNTGFLDRTRGS
jgi:hypothetical protein